MNVLVIGHKNPDTDSIISAIALSELLSRKGIFKAIPARAGELSRETTYILSSCGLKEPTLVLDVRPKAHDVMSRETIYVVKGTPVKKAGDLLIMKGIRSIPVVDEDLRVIGLFSVESFSRAYLKDFVNVRVRLTNVPLRNIVEVVNCEIINGDLNTLISGHIYVGAMDVKTIQRRYSFKDNIVIVGDREDVQLEAINSRASLLIVTGNLRPSDDVIELARRYNVPILVSPYDTYTTAKLVDLSRPVELFIDRAEVISESASVNEVINLMRSKLVRSVVVVDDYGKLVGIITRSDLIKDFRSKVVLVDHNERTQAVDGIEEAQVVAVIDHHRVSGDIKTDEAIIFRVEPVGATATIVYKLMREYDLVLSTELLRALLYAILSDTLLLRSPTTTSEDVNCVNMLLRDLNISLDSALKLVRHALSLNEPQDPREMVRHDLKEYEVNGYRFAIAQVLTVNPEKFMNMKDKLLGLINQLMKDNNLRLYMLVLTDYIDSTSHFIVEGDISVVEEAFNVSVVSNYFSLRNVTSRKSQILPPILKVINEKIASKMW